MLGRLARWLRLLGFDTLYHPHISDRDLLRCALREGRILLTRDTHFLRRKNLTTLFFVRSNDPREQVKEVMAAFAVEKRGPGRCSRCNGILQAVDERDSVRDMVPEFVFLGGRDFLRCAACGSVYWGGTHLKRFRAMLDTFFHGGNGEVHTQR